MTLVQYQGPQYQAADNLPEDEEEEEDYFKLEAICKEMKYLPQMIENLPTASMMANKKISANGTR